MLGEKSTVPFSVTTRGDCRNNAENMSGPRQIVIGLINQPPDGYPSNDRATAFANASVD